MTVSNLITRVDAVCKKYEKYEVDKQKEADVAGDDAFARLDGVFETEVDAALQNPEVAATEKNGATAVAMNAEIRRTKARLLDQISKLQTLDLEKLKGLSKEELEARSDLVSALKERTEGISDGSTTAVNQTQTGSWATSTSVTRIKFDSTSDGRFDSEYFQQTEESDRFRQEYEIRRMKQDEGLDVIAEGLDTLKDIAQDMTEELDRQVPLMDKIDEKVDKATSDIKNTNARVKDTLNQLGSSRNFCIDIILSCIILGIAVYLYNELKK